METVEIREDTTYTPYCVECRTAIAEAVTVQREAELAAAKHENEHHPEPEEEDA